ncbi:uncharacterized protein LOC143462445 isoform X2 [Clavelina lepadiformis]|uniref:uncharacterized protein LOC143462445 isoform X2 n=1 Tax=Clavelina lepadiformis TaxID=159417 RepID=UPI004042E0B3
MKAEEKAVCTECRCSVLAYAKKFSKRANYKEAVQDLPLKRICVERSVPSRLAATIQMKDKKIEELRNQVKKLLTSEDHVSVDALMAQDLNYLMISALQIGSVDEFHALMREEQCKLQTSKKCGERYHPAVIRFCLNLACKSRIAYQELRESKILRLPSLRTLNDYRKVYKTKPGLIHEVLQEIKLRST